jgi:hypothetical protein
MVEEAATHTQDVDVEYLPAPGHTQARRFMFHAQAVGMKLYRKGPAWQPEHERSHVTVIAAVERDNGPHIDLLGSRVSHFATLEEVDSLTFPSSSLATVS